MKRKKEILGYLGAAYVISKYILEEDELEHKAKAKVKAQKTKTETCRNTKLVIFALQ